MSSASGAAPLDGDSVAELIADRLPQLHAAERRVGRALLADYPAAGLGTVASLAAAASTSGPTVLRFAAALGFDGFPPLQESLKTELRIRSEGPLGVSWDPDPGSSTGRLLEHAETMATNAVSSLRGVPPQELDRAVALLSDRSRKVFTTGGRYSNTLARHLAVNLETIRPKVRYVEHPLDGELATIVGLGTRDVYVLFDFHRYQSSTIALARTIRRRGSTIVLVTDEHLSPAAAQAQVVLPINVSSPSPFYTFSSGIILVELLTRAVLQELGEKGQEHLARWDAVRQHELVGRADD